MKYLRLVLLLGLIPPFGIIIPAFIRDTYQSSFGVISFGALLAFAWLYAATSLHKQKNLSKSVSRLVLVLYLVIGSAGLVRYTFAINDFNSVVLLVLGSWFLIWIVVPLTLWFLIGRLGKTELQHQSFT